MIVCPWGSPDSNRSGPMDCAWYLEVGIHFEWLLPGLAQGCSVGFTAWALWPCLCDQPSTFPIPGHGDFFRKLGRSEAIL